MTASSFDALIAGYGVPAGHFDELLAVSRTPRPSWAAFGRLAGDLGPAQLSRAQARVARQIHENGVTYNVYADVGSPARPWALDVLPHLPQVDWSWPLRHKREALVIGLVWLAVLVLLVGGTDGGNAAFKHSGTSPAATRPSRTALS